MYPSYISQLYSSKNIGSKYLGRANANLIAWNVKVNPYGRPWTQTKGLSFACKFCWTLRGLLFKRYSTETHWCHSFFDINTYTNFRKTLPRVLAAIEPGLYMAISILLSNNAVLLGNLKCYNLDKRTVNWNNHDDHFFCPDILDFITVFKFEIRPDYDLWNSFH